MNSQHGDERGTEADYRLPRTAIPYRYALRIGTDLAANRFEGDAEIEIELHEPTNEIVCNAVELAISDATLTAPGGERVELGVELVPEHERVRFTAPAPVGPGEWELRCRFSGDLGGKLRGYYRSAFKDDSGAERAIASTHFEATDARRAFPCFDEPDLKAVFSITLDVPDDLFAVSNSPEAEVIDLGGGRRRVRFSDTMKMSTYLVAYAIGPFEATETVVADGVPLRVVVPLGKLHLTSFALEAATHCLGWFHEYFAIPYPAEKLDLVAIPDFAMGAMENLGCVTFREQDLLCNPEESSIPELARIAEVVEHEIAHMWFGDLVTMKWWNGIWLNEAFATFMSLRCLDDFRPEWNRWPMFGTETDMALQVDGLHSTRPIEYQVRRPDEAEAMFDWLTYLKGGSVLRMVEQYLGTTRFREGVRQYLVEHAYGNTETTDLWDAIEAASGGEPVRALLDGWIFQGGHPLVTARLEAGSLVLSAEPFRYLPHDELPPGSPPSSIGDDWLVPVLVEDRPGEARPVLLGPAPHGRDPLDCGAFAGLPVVNAGGSGAYRLCYEGPLFDRILSDLDRLQPLELFHLVSDSWACTLAGMSGLGDFLALVRRLQGHPDPNVWETVAGALNLVDRVAAGLAEEELGAFVRAAAGPLLDGVGFDVSGDDSAETQRVRALLIAVLGTVGADEAVRTRCREAFESSRADDGAALPPSIAQSVLTVVVASGGRGEFDLVREGFRRPADPLDEERHLSALTATRQPELAGEVLEMSRQEIRAQDAAYVIRWLLRNRWAGLQTWEFLTAHFDEISARLPSHAMPAILGGVRDLVQLDESGRPMMLEETRRFIAAHEFGGHQRTIDQALERQLVNARFATRNRPGIRELLHKA
jgi:puromycin-sensitive aminopeptidase